MTDYFWFERIPGNRTAAKGGRKINPNKKTPPLPFPPGTGVSVGGGTGVSVGGGSGVSVGRGSDVFVAGADVSVGIGVLVGGISVSVGAGVYVSVGAGVLVGTGEFVVVGICVFVGTGVLVGIGVLVGSGVKVGRLVGLSKKPPPSLTRVRKAKIGGTTAGVGEANPLAGVGDPAPGVAEGPVTKILKNESEVGVKKRLANACWVKIRSTGVGVGDWRGTSTTSEWASLPPETRYGMPNAKRHTNITTTGMAKPCCLWVCITTKFSS